MPNPEIISGMQIHAEKGWLTDHALLVAGDRIQAILPASAALAQHERKDFPADHVLVPGFIDLHIHGIGGHDVMDGTPETLWHISEALAKEGVTGFLATTMTSSRDHMEQVMEAVATAMHHPARQGAAILGVHLEGPFISGKKAGAQLAHGIEAPSLALIAHWQKISHGAIKLITLAPELPGMRGFIQALKDQGIVVSVGHTDATFTETQAGIMAGCSHATHLFNAMRGLHQREPGAAGALLLSDQVSAEVIADGIHVHPAMLMLALRVKGKDKLVLVTDAMRATCLGDGHYELGGQPVTVRQREARLNDGTLAGSVLTMSQAIKNMMDFTHLPLSDSVNLASINPARVLGIARDRGSLAVGKIADGVILNSRLEVMMTMRQGKIVYPRLKPVSQSGCL